MMEAGAAMASRGKTTKKKRNKNLGTFPSLLFNKKAAILDDTLKISFIRINLLKNEQQAI
jgi:hypothetical protein